MFIINKTIIKTYINSLKSHPFRKLTTNGNHLVESLQSILGNHNVSTSLAVRTQHGKDEGYNEPMAADVVVWPTNAEQVSQVSKLCYEKNVAIIPYGTGTGLEGGVNALAGGVCLDLSKMNQIIEVNAEDFDCTVEAGVTWRHLNEYLRDTGLWFPIDPGASASLGGMSATGASGTNAVAFGTMKQNVLNLEVVLPNGEIIYTSGQKCRSRKSSAGYNLTSLFVGSEGTLGTITKICLKLYAIPESVASGVCSFPSDQSAIDTVIQTLQSNIPVAKVEYLDDISIKACRSYSKIELPDSPTLFLEFNGTTLEEVNNRAEAVRQIAISNGGSNFEWSSDLETRKKLWKARHELYYACLALKPSSKALITDVCVPISRLTQMILKTKELIQKSGLIGPMFGHVGDGNFHAIIIFNMSDENDRNKVKLTAYQMGEYALELGGTCTGEHGIGRGKMALLRKQYDSEAIQLMKRIKHAFDPKNLMNPQKIF